MSQHETTEIPWPVEEGTTEITLIAGEWMANPASTKHPIVGPAEYSFTRHPDGGITVRMA